MIEYFHDEVCKACGGTGIQYNSNMGVNIICPVCYGRGKRQVSNMEGLPPGTYCYSQ